MQVNRGHGTRLKQKKNKMLLQVVSHHHWRLVGAVFHAEFHNLCFQLLIV